MKKLIGYGVACLVAAFAVSCLAPYTPKVKADQTNFLVVDGFLNDTSGITTVKLSRTSLVGNDYVGATEVGSSVFIEGDDGSSYPLHESPEGTYSAAKLPVTSGHNYRLNIVTASGSKYQSDFVPFKVTPPIDSVSWDVEDQDLLIYVNTHDPSNKTRYYLWTFDGTWSYHSAYYSTIKIVNGQIVQRDVLDDTYHCWRTAHSTEILTGSTKQLAQDVVSEMRVEQLPLTSERLQFEYSMLVEQVALTEEGYEYWQELKKNTENLGTIFGTLPSQNITNIHNTENVLEPVVGYFTAGSMTTKRIFIHNDQLPPSTHETGYETCETDTLHVNQLGQFSGAGTLIHEVFQGLTLIGYLTSSADCVDCTLHDGTNVKPAFWE